MRNNDLVREFIERLHGTRSSKEFLRYLEQSTLLRDMPNDLLNDLLNLENFDFNYYIGFLSKFRRNHGSFLGYEEKLIRISKILIKNFNDLNIMGQSITLLTTTKIIDNLDVVEFIKEFFKIKDLKKIDVIMQIIDKIQIGIANKDIMKIIRFVKNVEDEHLLSQIKQLYTNSNMTNSRDVDVYLDLINENLKNPSLPLFLSLIMRRDIRELPNGKFILTRYVLNTNSKNIRARNSLLFYIFSDDSLVNSNRFIELLNCINNCDPKQYEIIRKLIASRKKFKDSIFYTLLKEFMNATQEESDFMFALLNNIRIIDSDVELKFALDFMHKAKDEAQLIAYYKIFVVGDLKYESLDSGYASLITDAILKSNSSNQRKTLINLAKELKSSKYNASFINIIVETNNKLALDIFKDLLKIRYVKDSHRTTTIMKRLNNLKDEAQASVIMKIIETEKLFKSDNLFRMIDTVLHSKIQYVFAFSFIDKFMEEPFDKYILENNPNSSFMRLFRIVLTLKDPDKYEFIEKLFKYPELFKNPNGLGVIEVFTRDIKEKYKFDALLRYIDENYSSRFSFLSRRSVYIISLIKECKQKYQVDLLLNASKLTKYMDNEKEILERVSKIKKPIYAIYFYRLLKIKEILKSDKLFEILDIIESNTKKEKIEAMLYISLKTKIRASERFIDYYKFISDYQTKEQLEFFLELINYNIKETDIYKISRKLVNIKDIWGPSLIKELIFESDRIPMDLIYQAINKIIEYQDVTYITKNEKFEEALIYINDIFIKYTGESNELVEWLQKKYFLDSKRK